MDDKTLEEIGLVMKKVIYIDEKNYGDYKNLDIGRVLFYKSF